MKFVRKNFALVVGMAIPVVMVLAVVGSIYIPGFFAVGPKFDFLYMSRSDYYCYYNSGQQFLVEGGKVVKRVVDVGSDKFVYDGQCGDDRLFVHDSVKNVSSRVSFEEAQALNLDSSAKSPDGFEIIYGSRGDGIFPFFFSSGSNYNSIYLVGNNWSKKLDLELSGVDSNYSFHFLGWII